jgi:hypothetical protein
LLTTQAGKKQVEKSCQSPLNARPMAIAGTGIGLGWNGGRKIIIRPEKQGVGTKREPP